MIKSIKRIISLSLIFLMIIPMFSPLIVNAEDSNASTGKVVYQTYIEGSGWSKESSDGDTSGAVNQGKRLEGVKITVYPNNVADNLTGGIEYRVHQQDIGWHDWVSNGTLSGKVDDNKRLESIQIKLTGEIAKKYDVKYRAYVEDSGWQPWVENGQTAGTVGQAKRLEAIEIKIAEKPSDYQKPVKKRVGYHTYIEDSGWNATIYDGDTSGAPNEGKKIEGVIIDVYPTNIDKDLRGGVEYRVHQQEIGWTDWTGNGKISGKIDDNKRVEAIEIILTGEMAQKYDIKYRAYVEGIGWQKWVKNGNTAGTVGEGKRLEAIEIRVEEHTEEGRYVYQNHELFYFDNYFEHSSLEYDSHLATLSSYMTFFSMNLDYPNNTNDTKWYDEQSDTIRGAFEAIGFGDFEANDDYHKRTSFDSIGVAIASRKVGDYTIIAVVPRSGGYFLEWGNNVWLGDGSKSDYMHEGWYNAANKLITFLDNYISEKNITGNIKLWMAGYSRGGATTNIAAGLLDNKIDKGQKLFSNGAKLTRENLYAYTFEAPQGANVYSKTVKSPNDSLYNNIFNIINPDDLVPKVAMKEWGFTRFGIDKYIYTNFYSESKTKVEKEAFLTFYGEHSKVSEYKADQITMYGISGTQDFLVEYMPFGSLAVLSEYLIDGLNGVLYKDTRKANYDANIISTIITEKIANVCGSRENYVNKYQSYLKNALLKLMSDDKIQSKKDAEDLKSGLLLNVVYSVLSNKYSGSALPYKETPEDFNNAMYGLIKPVFDEYPNELITLGLNIENVFQNHEPLVTIAHMQAQDSKYIVEYNKTNNAHLGTSELSDNADMFRANFRGFNDLIVETDGRTVIHVEGFVLGLSEVRKAETGCAVGYYSYATEEKMKLFCLPNKEYTLTMKSYSKQIDHNVNYQAYYQFFKPNGVFKTGIFSSEIEGPYLSKLLDSYEDNNATFNTDSITRKVNAATGTGTAFGTGNIIIIGAALLVLIGFTVFSVIHLKNKKRKTLN